LPTARKASATPPDPQGSAPPSSATKPTAQAASVVEEQLVKPLAEKEAKRNHFSRVYIPPQVRRVRVLDGDRSTDGRGAEFVAFAVDERSVDLDLKEVDDSKWRKGAIVGCVYPARAEVFVKRGDKFFASGLLLGKKTSAADDTVCRPAPTLGAAYVRPNS
jgi:hypothetical protein